MSEEGLDHSTEDEPGTGYKNLPFYRAKTHWYLQWEVTTVTEECKCIDDEMRFVQIDVDTWWWKQYKYIEYWRAGRTRVKPPGR